MPTAAALLLILGTALLSAATVNALARLPRTRMLSLPTVAADRILPPPARGVVPGPLDGLPTPRIRALRRPVAAMVDNVPLARPQSGLSQASVVWEALVEGGITRLMPIYLERDAARLGPIRSTRPYFLDWAAPYHPLLLHDGGSPQAQRKVGGIRGLIDLDAARDGRVYHRISGTPAPHNLFTGTAAVRTLAQVRYPHLTALVPRLPHRAAGAPPDSVAARNIRITFDLPGAAANPQYTVSYQYDPVGGEYLRSVGGQPAVDSLTGGQLRAANVVIVISLMRPLPGDPLARISIQTTGTGKMIAFQGGREIRGRWSRPSAGSPLRLRDEAGRSVRMDPGVTWFEVVSPGSVRVK